MAAADALGVLEGEEADAAALREKHDQLFAAEARLWSERLSHLSDLPEEAAEPPASIWHEISIRTSSQNQKRRKDEGEWLPVGERIALKMLMVSLCLRKCSYLVIITTG